MSFAIDVNVLLYASDAASPRHAAALEFLERAAGGHEVLCLAWTTAMAYLRVATHPGIFATPLAPDVAMANLDALLAQPHVRTLAEDDGFWEVYRGVAQALPVRGNLVPDAHLAALLKQHGVRRLFTNDADFRKFQFLEVRSPFA